jgi:hypothetical protein
MARSASEDAPVNLRYASDFGTSIKMGRRWEDAYAGGFAPVSPRQRRD